MATGGEYQSIPGLKASSSLASNQYYPIKLSTTAGECKLATANTDFIVGILQNDPAAGEAAEVACIGICLARAGVADLAVGEALTVNTSGVADTTTGGQHIVGKALQASTAVGDLVKILCLPSVMGD